jgi:hypothetical protein
MNIYYATNFEANFIDGQTIKSHCQCGESYAIQYDKENQVIICDACTDTVSNYERFYIRIDEKKVNL